jgi:hypothetical protein
MGRLPYSGHPPHVAGQTGLRGISGNKGAVAIRLEYHNTSFCFVTAHLAAGHGNVQERNADFWTIDEGLKFPRGLKIDSHECVRPRSAPLVRAAG